MKIPSRVRRVAVFVTAFVAGLWIADRFLSAQSATQPVHSTSTTAPSTQASIDPAAQVLLEKVAAAYAKMPISIEGALTIDFDVAGIKQKRTARLIGSALSATQLKHEIEGEVQIVVDDRSSNILDLKQNQYLTKEHEASTSVASDELIVAMLREQNPALLLAVTSGSTSLLFAGGESVSVEAGAAEPNLEVLLASDEKDSTRYFVQKSTGLLDRVEVDFRPMLEKQGAREVKSALATLRYSKTDFNPTLDAAAFAFKPPADAIEAAKQQGKELLGAAGEPSGLVGKPAPAFELSDPDGRSVSLESLKGKVVVLDFWATWCGPCRAAMPILDQVSKAQASRDVAVFAVNVGEDAGTVSTYLKEQKLSLNALLDIDSVVSKKYLAYAIPQTVIIGRDGVIRHVSVGAGGSYQADLEQQIDAALK